MPKIVVQEGQKERVFEYEGGRVTFGQAKAVIQVNSPGISDIHCEITDTPEGFRLKDLETKQGTKLNGKSISTAFLRDGDQIQLGKVKITFWEEDIGSSESTKPEKRATKRSAKRSEDRDEYEDEEEERPRRKRSSRQSNPLLGILSILVGIGIIVGLLFGTNIWFGDKARVEKLYSIGITAFGRGDYQKAIDCFSQIDPDFPTYGVMAQEKYKEAQIKKAKADSGTQLRELRESLYRIFKENGRTDVETSKRKLKEWIQSHAAESPALAKEAQDEIDRLEQLPPSDDDDRRRE